MADSNNKQRSGFFSNAFGVAKKLSHTGLNILNQVSPDTASALTNATTGDSASTKTGGVLKSMLTLNEAIIDVKEG